MKIYFYSADSQGGEAKTAIRHLKNLGVEIYTADTPKGSTDSTDSVAKLDALLILGTRLDAQAGYLAAWFLSQNKKVWYLLPQGSSLDPSLAKMQEEKNFQDKLKIEFYHSADLGEKISQFLSGLEQGLIELFNIKYTLRVSRQIGDYLNWKARQTGTKKADWLRDQIREMMEADQDYQDYLKNRFKTAK